MLGDGEFDASSVYDAAGAAGYQLLAPREHAEAGLGHTTRARTGLLLLVATTFR